MYPVRNDVGTESTIRYIDAPESIPCFQHVTMLWHLESGEVLLERESHRDCLVPEVDVVDVPASGHRRTEDAVAVEPQTALEVVQRGESRCLRELTLNGRIG